MSARALRRCSAIRPLFIRKSRNTFRGRHLAKAQPVTKQSIDPDDSVDDELTAELAALMTTVNPGGAKTKARSMEMSWRITAGQVRTLCHQHGLYMYWIIISCRNRCVHLTYACTAVAAELVCRAWQIMGPPSPWSCKEIDHLAAFIRGFHAAATVQDREPKVCSACNGEKVVECPFCHGTSVMQLGDTVYCSDTACAVCPACNGEVRA